MHELAIAQSIIEAVGHFISGEQASRVRTIHLRVGGLAGVLPESLDFCFSAIVADTQLRRARLHIEAVPIRGRCGPCGAEFAVCAPIFLCQTCGNPVSQILSGDELDIVTIELEEERLSEYGSDHD